MSRNTRGRIAESAADSVALVADVVWARRRLYGHARLGRQRWIQLEERVHDPRIERFPAFLLQHAQRGWHGHGALSTVDPR